MRVEKAPEIKEGRHICYLIGGRKDSRLIKKKAFSGSVMA